MLSNGPDDDVGHFLVAWWSDAHFVESLVGPVLGMVPQVDAVVLHPVEIVAAVQHLDGHSLELGHGQPVLPFFIKAWRRCCVYSGQHVGYGGVDVLLAPVQGVLVAEVPLSGYLSDYHGHVNFHRGWVGINGAGAVRQEEQDVSVPGVLCGVGDGDFPGVRVHFPEPEVSWVLGRSGGHFMEVFDVYPVSFRVACDLVFQFLAGQDLPDGRVVDAVGPILFYLGEGYLPAYTHSFVRFQICI